ncbi:MAG: ATP-binding protein [Patescibacteria group bacterium]
MIFNILSIITLTLTLLLGLYVYSNDRKNKINIVFSLLILSATAWIFTNLMTDLSRDLYYIKLWSKLVLVGPVFIGYFFYRLSLILPKEKKQGKKIKWTIHLAVLVLLVLIPTDLNVSSVYFLANDIPAITPGPLYVFYLLYLIGIIALAFRNFFENYQKLDSLSRLQVQYISLGLGISACLGSVTNIVFPILGSSEFVNFGPYFILIFIFFTTFAIIKYKLFNVRVIATELIIFSLWIFIFIRALLETDLKEKVIEYVLLLITVVVGIFLIRSVIKEIAQREKIQKLANDLQGANDKLKEMDRQKSEFVSFATHQLRAPLTAMKGYASLLLEGEMGVIPPEGKTAIGRIFESTNTLAAIVDDYLNVTRIELGSIRYTFDTIDLKDLIENVIAELKPNIDKATQVKFSVAIDKPTSHYRVTADKDKLKQVIANLVDNSVKYTPQGTVKVSLSQDLTTRNFVFKIQDTGIGISAEILPKLFQKWSRANNANKTNIKGTGLGLYVAKEIITAHHGTIRVESPGEGKGSTFTVELVPVEKV